MKLEELSKVDLIWVVKRLLQMCCLGNEKHYLKRALSDLEYEKERQRMDEALKLMEETNKKRRELAAMLAPYSGKPLSSIPAAVWAQVGQLEIQISKADRKWFKLMEVRR